MAAESTRPEWLKEIPKGVIAAIGGLIVSFVGANIAFYWWAPETLRDTVNRQKEMVDSVTDQLKIRTRYGDLANASQRNSLDRMNELRQWSTPEQFKKNAVEIHKRSAIARSAVNQELGGLRAYSPSSTGLSLELHSADLRSLTDELAVWESLDSLVETATTHGPTSPDYQVAFDRWIKSVLDYQGAMASVEESAKRELTSIPAEQRELERKEQAMHAAFHDYRKRMTLAIGVVDVLWIGAFALLAYFLLRRPRPAPLPDPTQSPAKRKSRRR